MTIDPLAIICHLSESIGGRAAGTDGEFEAGDYLSALLCKNGLESDIQAFQYRGWKAGAAASLACEREATTLRGLAFPYTFPTPLEGMQGRITDGGTATIIRDRVVCQRFFLVSDTGQPRGRILVAPYDEVRPLPNPHATDALPTVLLAKQHLKHLHRWCEDQSRLILISAGEESLSVGRNIIVAPATDGPVILLVSHYDCVFGSPGANDNASGVAVAMSLMERSVAAGLPVRLLLTSAEELMFRGAEAYLALLQDEDRLDEIGACLCIDMVGIGEELKIRAPRNGPWHHLGADLFYQNMLHRETPSSDHWIFHEVGIPSAQLTRQVDPEHHSPYDVSSRIAQSAIQDSLEIGWRLLSAASDRLLGTPVGGSIGERATWCTN